MGREDTIKMNLKNKGSEDVNQIELDQDRFYWRTFVSVSEDGPEREIKKLWLCVNNLTETGSHVQAEVF